MSFCLCFVTRVNVALQQLLNNAITTSAMEVIPTGVLSSRLEFSGFSCPWVQHSQKMGCSEHKWSPGAARHSRRLIPTLEVLSGGGADKSPSGL